MTTTMAPSPSPAVHELVLHEGTADLVDLMVPFAREGVAAGDQVVVMGEADFVSSLLTAVPGGPRLRAVIASEDDRFPARELRRFDRMLAELDGTVPGVRVVNQMPTMTPDRWLEWRRYEAAVNAVVDPYRVWGKCGYDIRALEPDMVADLRISHPYVQTSRDRHRSPDFENLGTRTHAYLDVPGHPVESGEPTLVLDGASAADARRAVRALAARSGLSPTAQESVVLATSEAVANANEHGRPPVLVRAWVGDGGRLTVAVSDGGPGPHPLVGMLPETVHGSSPGGMWIVHLLLPHVHHRRGDEGYTVTFSVDGGMTSPSLAG